MNRWHTSAGMLLTLGALHDLDVADSVELRVFFESANEDLPKTANAIECNNVQSASEVNFTLTGHYDIDVYGKQETYNLESGVLLLEEKMSKNEKKQTAMKLHKQFRHAPAANLKKLMRIAGIKDPEV
ncbi:hypothetical protein RRG08_023037 [Elysia crispata]|uniref:Uncharacterized protein n=1 Tax=Elysia crispata TaxID=231223 RepID=A0AAE0YM02_9GAST|nr:hypothetical protein RRG08_023037 [Elysia crispata]